MSRCVFSLSLGASFFPYSLPVMELVCVCVCVCVCVVCGVNRWGRELELGWLMSGSQVHTAPRVSMQAGPSQSNASRPTCVVHVIGV